MKLRTTLTPLLFIAVLPLAAIAAENEAPGNAADEPMSGSQLSRDERTGSMGAQGAPGGTDSMSPAAGDAGDSNIFRELDVNRDGFVSKEEARRSADISARFNDLDSDKDNRISASEFRKSTQSRY